MTTDRIQQALAKAYEDVSQFNEKYFPIVTAERRAALAVIEAARFVYDLREDRHYDANESAYLVGEYSLAKLQHAINAWADAVLGDKP